MNITELQIKIDDVIKTLQVAFEEIRSHDEKRLLNEKQGYALSQREQAIYVREVGMKKREADIEAQKKVFDDQTKNTQTILNKIALEKETLKNLVNDKRIIEQERSHLEEEKKGLEGLKKEQETLRIDRNRFEQDKKLFEEEKHAIAEQVKLMALKEQNLKIKEERLDKIERMTQV